MSSSASSAAMTGMDMASSTMTDMASSTGMAMPASTAASMSGMDMGGMGGNGCKISVRPHSTDPLTLKAHGVQMLWNWETVDSCFLSSSWHVRSNGAFAGSCIGVIFLVLSLELLRRAQREFDRYLLRQNRSQLTSMGSRGSSSDESNEAGATSTSKNASSSIKVLGARSTDYVSHLKLWQQAVRSFLFMMQFAVGYFVMLLAMYYNGKCWRLLKSFSDGRS